MTSTTTRVIPLAQLRPSKLNPRRTYDPTALQELGASLQEGQTTALLVRPDPDGKHFEIAAGERRYRAATLVKLASLRCEVRAMTDEDFLRILNTENLQRVNLTALEEGEGFKRMLAGEATVASIADRMKKPHNYIYDRLRLADLSALGKKLLTEGRLGVGQAILIARLAPAHQAEALDQENNHVWRSTGADLFEKSPYAGVTIRTATEVSEWINRHCLLAPDSPELFEREDAGTAAQLVAAEEAEVKVVHISLESTVPPEARTASAQKIYGPLSWARADGAPCYDARRGMRVKSKRCELSVLGLVVIGRLRGEAFEVCVNKAKCRTHYGTLIAAREKRERAKLTGKPADKAEATKAEDKYAAQRKRDEATREKARQHQARYLKALTKLKAALVTAARTAPLATLISMVEREKNAPSNAEAYVRWLASNHVQHNAGNRYWIDPDRITAMGKLLGVDTGAIVNAVAPINAKPKRKAKKKGAKA